MSRRDTKRALQSRLSRVIPPSLDPHFSSRARHAAEQARSNVAVDCGWGDLILAQTYAAAPDVAAALQNEPRERRNIAMYVRDPHVILAQAPDRLFLDPSHTYRLWLSQHRSVRRRPGGFRLRRLRTRGDAEGVNRMYELRQMVPVDPAFVWRNHISRVLTYVVAEDLHDGRIVGTVTGLDHVHAFDDPELGASLWCLAVDPQAAAPGVGEALVRYLADHYLARGREFLDLSVMHDNAQAIALYDKLGFRRVPVFAIKHKNAINEPLFTAPVSDEDRLNIYARIIVDEARRRGIQAEVVDAEHGYFRLSLGGRSVLCRESLSEYTSAMAMSRCQDKRVTRRVLRAAGLKVPAQRPAGAPAADCAFLAEHGAVVVKPVNGEQGHGVCVDVRDETALVAAIETARRYGDDVILEEYVKGRDLRIVVIDGQVVAAAIRTPPAVVGDGRSTIRALIEKLSRRRAAATGGESRIPLDAETGRCVRLSGYRLDDVLPAGRMLDVRRTANLHTGGTIHDVTAELHPQLAEAARAAAAALEIPVVGFDFIVPAVDAPEYVIIEANERVGLANHEPQPTAERFVDLLFPQTVVRESVHARA